MIDASWSGFVDLRQAPERVSTLNETQLLPALGTVLLRLNAPTSPYFTAKCDVWRVEAIDPFEFDAPPEPPVGALACYVDLLACDPQYWSEVDVVGHWCEELTAALRALPLSCCRTDLILRRAIGRGGNLTLGTTAYVAACGPRGDAAKSRLADVLAAVADTVESLGPHNTKRSKLQWGSVGE